MQAQTLDRVTPAPPESLLPEIEAAWFEFWVSPLAEYMQHTDLLALRRLFMDYDELERTRAAMYTDPGPKPEETDYETYNDWQHAIGEYNAAVAANGRLTRDPRGGLRINPLLSHYRMVEANIIKQEDRFGFSLRARQELGLNEMRARTLAEQNTAQVMDAQDDEPDPRAALRLAAGDS